MLWLKSRISPAGSNLDKLNRSAKDGGQGQGRPKNLPAPFAVRSVYPENSTAHDTDTILVVTKLPESETGIICSPMESVKETLFVPG